MNRNERNNFLRELSEKLQEVNEIFDDNGISSPSLDCEDDECDLPEDEDILTIRQLFKDIILLIEAND